VPAPSGLIRILNDIIQDAERERTQREVEAGYALVLGVGSIKDLIEAKRQARRSPSSR